MLSPPQSSAILPDLPPLARCPPSAAPSAARHLHASPRRQPAIGDEDAAGAITGFVRGEKGDQRCHLLESTQAPHGDLRHEPRFPCCRSIAASTCSSLVSCPLPLGDSPRCPCVSTMSMAQR